MGEINDSNFDNSFFRRYSVNQFCDAVKVDPAAFWATVISEFTLDSPQFTNLKTRDKVEAYFKDRFIPRKIEVYNAGLKLLRTSWFEGLEVDDVEFRKALILHNISRFAADEAIGYAFCNPYDANYDGLFDSAHKHNRKYNRNQPQYYACPPDDKDLPWMAMPMVNVLVMIADWIALCKLNNIDFETYLVGNLRRYKWYPSTSDKVKQVLEYMGFVVKHFRGYSIRIDSEIPFLGHMLNSHKL